MCISDFGKCSVAIAFVNICKYNLCPIDLPFANTKHVVSGKVISHTTAPFFIRMNGAYCADSMFPVSVITSMVATNEKRACDR